MFRKNNQQGLATLLVIFSIGIASLLLVLGFSELSVRQAQLTNDNANAQKAYYAAHAGIEDAIMRLKFTTALGQTTPVTFTSNNLPNGFDDATYSVTIDPVAVDERKVTSNGTHGGAIKTIEVTVINSEESPGFLGAVQTGTGGFEVEQGAKICQGTCIDGNGDGDTSDPGECGCTAGTGTNVYSNGDVEGRTITAGETNACDKNGSNSSKIIGSVTAVGDITNLNGSGDGICISKNATASNLDYCKVGNNGAATSSPGAFCTINGTFSTVAAPTPIALPDLDPQFWRDQAFDRGGVWPLTGTKNCVIGGTASEDCSDKSTDHNLGPLKINGNLTVNSNEKMTVKGPIWVTGNITVNSNAEMAISSEFTNSGTVVITDNEIYTNSNVKYSQSGNAIVMYVSMEDDVVTGSSPPDYDCGAAGSNAAINISSNSNNVLFYAYQGCVWVRTNSNFYGAVVGQKVHIDNNATFYYNTILSTAVFGVSAGGGWLITGWRDID